MLNSFLNCPARFPEQDVDFGEEEDETSEEENSSEYENDSDYDTE